MVKRLIPVSIVVFLLVSFAFFEGWPFRGAKSPEGDQTTDLQKDGTFNVEEGGASNRQGQSPQPIGDGDLSSGGSADAATWKKRLDELKTGDPEIYRQALSKALLDSHLPRDFRFGLVPDLRTVNASLLFSPAPFSKAFPVTVRSGDNLSKVAAKARQQTGTNVTPAFLMLMNQMENDRLKIKDVLKVPSESLSLLVRKGDFKLYVLLGGVVALDYNIGTGKDDSTPEGRFKISGKTKNPTWTMPNGRVVRFGSPDHIIGTRWMSFDNDKGRTSFGIHGTTEEETIGFAASAGCVRMRRVDVEALFELIPEGAEVEIRN